MKKQLYNILLQKNCNPRYQGKTKTFWVSKYPEGDTIHLVEKEGFNILIEL